jgi:hypothetical protein
MGKNSPGKKTKSEDGIQQLSRQRARFFSADIGRLCRTAFGASNRCGVTEHGATSRVVLQETVVILAGA